MTTVEAIAVELWVPVTSPDKLPVKPAELPLILPVTWEPGKLRAESVVKVLFEVAVTLDALPLKVAVIIPRSEERRVGKEC